MSDQSTQKSRKLLDQIRDAIRLKHYSDSTEKTYVHWAKRYSLFHNQRHPAEMGATILQLICWKPGMTFARCRSCLGKRMSKPP